MVDIQLTHLERLLGDRKLKLDLDDAAKDYLVDRGYEPALGARPVKRSILRNLQDPLAHALLSGKFADGTTIRVRGGRGRAGFRELASLVRSVAIRAVLRYVANIRQY